MDFGVGRELDAPANSGGSGGTPLYMAPELFTGSEASIASDVYSVGVLLFYLVTGRYPVAATSRSDLEQSHAEGRRRLLRDVRADLPDAFVEVVERACATQPRDRFQTAGALQEGLARVIGASAERPTPAATSSRWIALAIAALLVLAVGGTALMRRSTDAARELSVVTSPVPSVRPAEAGPAADPDQYQIRAVFRRVRASDSEPLQAGARVAPGDRLFLEVHASRPVHVYVVNEDERGASFLLFPLPGGMPSNPLAAGPQRLPGSVDWEVTSAGGREHFLVVASPEPLLALEGVLARLPAPTVGGPSVVAAPLSRDVVGQLRGVGGLAPRPPGTALASELAGSTLALTPDTESVKGPWMRQLTLTNPGR
jgi:hypothetical protein